MSEINLTHHQHLKLKSFLYLHKSDASSPWLYNQIYSYIHNHRKFCALSYTKSFRNVQDKLKFFELDILHGSAYTEPNSSIHFLYFSRSSAETLLLTFWIAAKKSSRVGGNSSSSFGIFRISSAPRPLIRRLNDIIAASLFNIEKDGQLHAIFTFKNTLLQCFLLLIWMT